MSNILKEFQDSLRETNQFPKDELTEYYLVSSKAMIESNPAICKEIYNDSTALMMVFAELVKPNSHHIRHIHLNLLAMDILDNTSKEILNYQDKDGNSAIHISTKLECFSVGLWDCMKDSGANFSLINKNGETPLIKVSTGNSLDDVKCIHAYSTARTLDHRDLLTGSTALMHAIYNERINNIFYLLESGSSLFTRNDDGKNTIEIISSQNYIQKVDNMYYKELLSIIDLFRKKQEAELSIKSLSSGEKRR